MIVEPEDRDAMAKHFFNDPHPYTVEDIQWSFENFGMTLANCVCLFTKAERLFVVVHNDVPMYMFGLNNGWVSTASHVSLSAITLTKELVRFSRSAFGRAALKGSMSAVDLSDIENGMVRMSWGRALNFEPWAIKEFGSQVFQIMKFKEL